MTVQARATDSIVRFFRNFAAMEELFRAVKQDVELSTRAQHRLAQMARGALMYDLVHLEGTGRLAIASVGRMRSECMPARKKSPRKLSSRKKRKRAAADAASTDGNEGELSDSATTIASEIVPTVYADYTVEPPRFDFPLDFDDKKHKKHKKHKKAR